MPFVLDASIVVAWAFADEHHPIADAALDRLAADDGAAPSLWWFEVRNALLAMVNNPTPTSGHWNILDIYSPDTRVSHVATD